MHFNKTPCKTPALGAALAMAALLAAAPSQAADVDVGVSIGINQPGVYGRIDIGRYPQPQVIVQRPVLIVQQPPAYRSAPIYLRVPPGHRQNWRKHCGAYNACGTPVYFVQERWYQDHVLRGGPGRGGPRGGPHGAPHGGPHGGPDVRHDDHRGARHGGPDHGHPGRGPGNGRGHD